MQATAPFLTGLGLFFCGVHFVSINLVPLTDRRMPPMSQDALLTATMLFARVVWLARKCAILLHPEQAGDRKDTLAESTA